jgi:hypothetical protein
MITDIGSQCTAPGPMHLFSTNLIRVYRHRERPLLSRRHERGSRKARPRRWFASRGNNGSSIGRCIRCVGTRGRAGTARHGPSPEEAARRAGTEPGAVPHPLGLSRSSLRGLSVAAQGENHTERRPLFRVRAHFDLEGDSVPSRAREMSSSVMTDSEPVICPTSSTPSPYPCQIAAPPGPVISRRLLTRCISKNTCPRTSPSQLSLSASAGTRARRRLRDRRCRSDAPRPSARPRAGRCPACRGQRPRNRPARDR